VLRDGFLRLRKGYEWADPSDRTQGAVRKATRLAASPTTSEDPTRELEQLAIELPGFPAMMQPCRLLPEFLVTRLVRWSMLQ
jgi:hypothetical protein